MSAYLHGTEYFPRGESLDASVLGMLAKESSWQPSGRRSTAVPSPVKDKGKTNSEQFAFYRHPRGIGHLPNPNLGKEQMMQVMLDHILLALKENKVQYEVGQQELCIETKNRIESISEHQKQAEGLAAYHAAEQQHQMLCLNKQMMAIIKEMQV
ncbi:hypothetical protein H4R24_004096 [Coemansia sp. RSA 988]|nr:hypothetical protein H4R24_004096 [Coemansia sp. RSA 988]